MPATDNPSHDSAAPVLSQYSELAYLGMFQRQLRRLVSQALVRVLEPGYQNLQRRQVQIKESKKTDTGQMEAMDTSQNGSV